jgi:hypothetical protein
MIWVLCSVLGLVVEIMVIIGLGLRATSDDEEARTSAQAMET